MSKRKPIHRDARTERIDSSYERTDREGVNMHCEPEAGAPAPQDLGHDEPLGAGGDVPPERLVDAARAARQHAYAPYSRFRVGAAVVTDAGVFTGVNVENASYPLSVCAERNAIAAAVAAGARRVLAVAVIADTPEPISPCGGCRQVIREFGRDVQVHLANTRGKLRSTTIEALLPGAFGPEDLGVPTAP